MLLQGEQSFSEKNRSPRLIAVGTNVGKKLIKDTRKTANPGVAIFTTKAYSPETEPITDRMKLIKVHFLEMDIVLILPLLCISLPNMNGEKIPNKK